MKDKPPILVTLPEDSLREVNLVRAWWILIVTTTFTVLFTISGHLTGTSAAFETVQIVDYTGSALSFGLFCLARWGSGEWLRRVLPTLYALFFVLINDAYYFSAWPVAGDNVGYAFGVLTPAALLYLRPRAFVPFLVVNHLCVCAGILHQPVKFEATVGAIYGTTITMLIAAISSVIQYRTKVGELAKAALIAKRNQELAAANSSLLEMSQRVDEMMALAAHDLRAPLQGLAVLCEMELEKPEWQGKERGRIFEVIKEGSERMAALVNNMLAEYSARHDSIAGLALEECDVAPILREMGKHAEPLAARKNIEIALVEFPVEAMAEANEEALERVFGNLISNAIKYSPEGSRVELGLRRAGERWLCEVRDEGPGVPEKDRPALFRKLQKGSNLPTSGEESSGLGLYIATKLVEAMRGSIEFEPGRTIGSVFRVSLPAAESKA